MPLPTTRLVDERWPLHHRRSVEQQMVDECTITRPGGAGTVDPVTGATTYPQPTTVYSGACRLQQTPRDRRHEEELTVNPVQVPLHRYYVAVPASVDAVHINDQLVVDACAADPMLVGRVLVVVDVLAGSLVWQRDLICKDNTPTSMQP